MDVNVDSQFIVAERERRAWSQQHVADASGLALRTVQRIESRGTASYDSIQALAACFGVPITPLRAVDIPSAPEPARKRRWVIPATAASLLLAVGGVLWLRPASAKQVLFDFGVTIDRPEPVAGPSPGRDVQNYRSQFLLVDGETKEMRFQERFDLVFTPRVLQDGNVLLTMKIYEQRETGRVVVGQPTVIATNGKGGPGRPLVRRRRPDAVADRVHAEGELKRSHVIMRDPREIPLKLPLAVALCALPLCGQST